MLGSFCRGSSTSTIDLGNKAAQQIEHVLTVSCNISAQCLRGLERPATSKHRQSPHEALFCLGEQLIAPVDGGLQCLLSAHGGAMATGQQPKAVVEACSDLVDAECGEASSRQLDRQWNAVEPLTDLRGG